MTGYDKLRHQIYLSVYYKYDNNIIPTLPRIILTYILNNPQKANLYINKEIHVGMILNYLSGKSLEEKDILNEIVEFVEVKHCRNT